MRACLDFACKSDFWEISDQEWEEFKVTFWHATKLNMRSWSDSTAVRGFALYVADMIQTRALQESQE